MKTIESLVDADLRSLIEDVLRPHDCRDERDLWQQLVELGLGDLTGREERGGSGATWHEGAELVRALARCGCALPVGESDLVAGWLLDQVGLRPPPALRDWLVDDGANVGPREPHPLADRATVIRRVPDGWQLAEVEIAAVEHRRSAGQWPGLVSWHAIGAEVTEGARARAALVRAVQITGAMEAVLDLCVDHARTREQFGRPVGRFQAVQGLLATLAAETALARAAADAAVLLAADSNAAPERLLPAVAVARSCAGHAAEPVVRNAHQVIGAIGTTREHRLPGFTARILAWRSDDGGTRAWDKAVLQYGLDGVPLSELNLATDPR